MSKPITTEQKLEAFGMHAVLSEGKLFEAIQGMSTQDEIKYARGVLGLKEARCQNECGETSETMMSVHDRLREALTNKEKALKEEDN